MYKLGIITCSDKGFNGEREDLSGIIIKEAGESLGFITINYQVIPDEKEIIKEKLIEFSDIYNLDLILTTGGTGFSKRDVTPEATKEVGEREVPGIAEAIRYFSLKKTSRAMLSRGCSVIRKNTVIVNLPGSPIACKEILIEVLPTIKHGIDILKGTSSECGRKD